MMQSFPNITYLPSLNPGPNTNAKMFLGSLPASSIPNYRTTFLAPERQLQLVLNGNNRTALPQVQDTVMTSSLQHFKTKRNAEPQVMLQYPFQNLEMSQVKKVKLDNKPEEEMAISSVSHTTRTITCSGLPANISDSELLSVALPFGKVANLLTLKNQSKAYLEMEQEAASSSMVEFYQSNSLQIRGCSVSVAHSNQKEGQSQPTPEVTSQTFSSSSSTMLPQTILRITTDPTIHPVTLDIITNVVSCFGKILRAVHLTDSVPEQFLIQMVDEHVARSTKASLNGQSLFAGCILHVEFSTASNLNVTVNNAKSRDYTNGGSMLATESHTPNISTQMIANPMQLPFQLNGTNPTDGMQLSHTPYQSSGIGMQNMPMLTQMQTDYASCLVPPNVPYLIGNHQYAALQNALSPMTPALNSQIIHGYTSAHSSQPVYSALSQASYPTLSQTTFPALSAGQSLANQQPLDPLFGLSTVQGTDILSGGVAGVPTNGFISPEQCGYAVNCFGLPSPMTLAGLPLGTIALTPVILVSNLNDQIVTPDALYTLFGVYGDIQRVKILFNKKDNALIQYSDVTQAHLAIQYLDKAMLYGKHMRVTPSKHIQVQMPKDGQPDTGLTKDFSSSPLHRFKKPGSKNYNNIFPPSAVLHLSNIPSATTEECLTELFSKHGTVEGFKFFPKDHKMSLLQMSTVEEATHSLIAFHNYQLDETQHLRVSFTKSKL